MSLLDGGKPGAGRKPGDDEGLESYVSAGKPDAAKAPGAVPPRPGGGVFSGLRVSLMPSELEGSKRIDPGKLLLVLALVLVIETAVILGGYFFVNKTLSARAAKRDELLVKVAALGNDIVKEEGAAKDIVAYQAQVEAAVETLDRHVSWTSFFAFLEKKTIPSVKYLNFSGDADSGTATLDAIGLTYRDVAEQIVQFREDASVADVRTSSASARISQTGEVTGVSFTLVLKLKPEVWKKAAGAVATASSAPSPSAPASTVEPTPTPAPEANVVPAAVDSVPPGARPSEGFSENGTVTSPAP